MQACTRVWTRVFIQFSNRPLLTSLPPGTLVVMFSRTHSQLAASSRRDPDRIQPLASDVDRQPPPPPPGFILSQAELQGALPPPGAPPGARAPINPRASCPVYAAELTTEVLSAASQQVSCGLLPAGDRLWTC